MNPVDKSGGFTEAMVTKDKKRVVSIGGKRLSWRLRERMEAAGIRSARELHRRLRSVDPDAVVFSRLAEMIDDVPPRLSSRTLLALALALECQIGDLLVIDCRA